MKKQLEQQSSMMETHMSKIFLLEALVKQQQDDIDYYMHSAGILDEAWQLTIKQLTKARKDKRTTYNDYLVLKQSLGDDKVAGIFKAAQ